VPTLSGQLTGIKHLHFTEFTSRSVLVWPRKRNRTRGESYGPASLIRTRSALSNARRASTPRTTMSRKFPELRETRPAKLNELDTVPVRFGRVCYHLLVSTYHIIHAPSWCGNIIIDVLPPRSAYIKSIRVCFIQNNNARQSLTLVNLNRR